MYINHSSVFYVKVPFVQSTKLQYGNGITDIFISVTIWYHAILIKFLEEYF
jgi:hypothetical protein